MGEADYLDIEILERELILLADEFIERFPFENYAHYRGKPPRSSRSLAGTGVDREVSHGLDVVGNIDTREVIRTSKVARFLGRTISQETISYQINHIVDYTSGDGRIGPKFDYKNFSFVVGEANPKQFNEYLEAVNQVADWLAEADRTDR